MRTTIFSALISDSGAFTWEQARRAGVSVRHLRVCLADGRIRKLGHDLYTIAASPTSPTEVHLELLKAAIHRYGKRVMASDHSALIAHGLPTYDADLSQVNLLWRNSGSTRTSGPLRIRRTKFGYEPVEVDGIPSVSEASAFVQCAALFGLLSAVVAGDAMLHRETTTMQDLAAECDRLATHPGRSIAREALDKLDAQSESPGESVLRMIACEAGLELVSQYTVIDGGEVVARADFRVAGTRLLIEFDGKVKYRSATDLWREKQREDRLRRLGYGVERVIWSDFDTPRAMIVRLREAARLYRDPSSVA